MALRRVATWAKAVWSVEGPSRGRQRQLRSDGCLRRLTSRRAVLLRWKLYGVAAVCGNDDGVLERCGERALVRAGGEVSHAQRVQDCQSALQRREVALLRSPLRRIRAVVHEPAAAVPLDVNEGCQERLGGVGGYLVQEGL